MAASDITRTATQDARNAGEGHNPGLIIVHHADPNYIGATTVLQPRQRLLLGRESERFVPGALNDDRVSREHATIRRQGALLEVSDNDSRNGTWVNGQRVTSQQLLPGDIIGIGKTLLLVEDIDPKRLHRPHARMKGTSAALGKLLERIEFIARHDLMVLVLGESGVGKELAANEVHLRSGRRGLLVSVNCATLPDSLVQSELFGHARGAFSGADRPRRGLVDQARGGTLFLDEIGEASPLLQANLLRLLQEREIRPVGTDEVRKVDVRFVAATNRDLVAEVQAGRFREDLYSRMNRAVVQLPPLRQRREDILPLAHYFVSSFANKSLPISQALALELLLHDWPGNARTLQGVMQRLVIEAETDTLDIPPWLSDELALHARQHPSAGDEPSPDEPKSDREGLIALLRKHGGNVSAVAAELGVSRNTLYRWLKREQLRPEEHRA
jgi:transcriptional regulator with PAS, ATPase and Fis domain